MSLPHVLLCFFGKAIFSCRSGESGLFVLLPRPVALRLLLLLLPLGSMDVVVDRVVFVVEIVVMLVAAAAAVVVVPFPRFVFSFFFPFIIPDSILIIVCGFLRIKKYTQSMLIESSRTAIRNASMWLLPKKTGLESRFGADDDDDDDNDNEEFEVVATESAEDRKTVASFFGLEVVFVRWLLWWWFPRISSM